MHKATAVAHAIQGLVKYHGLKDRRRRLPFHDSISVCAEALTTRATIDFNSQYSYDLIEIGGRPATETEAARVRAVVQPLASRAKAKWHFRLSSTNNLPQGKGLGFSASAFAAISLATANALDLEIDLQHLSEYARLGAGSASRSVVGGFSIWYANRGSRSYAEQIPTRLKDEFAMSIVPIPSQVKTEIAHEESITSPFFAARVKEAKLTLPKMIRAIRRADIAQVGRLTEAESMSLHAVTMTGKNQLFLMAPDTIRVIQEVVRMREQDGIPAWFSLDTGPSVYVNTQPDFIDTVTARIERTVGVKPVKSGVGGPAHINNEHLF